MQRIQLEVAARSDSGKGAARRLRRDGRIPAVMYGGGVDPVPVSVDRLELDKIVSRSANPLIDLKGDEAVDGRMVLLKEMQRDPVRRVLIHCDFYAVDASQTITISVPLHFEGKPIGVEMGGVLEPLMRELEIQCSPMTIPESIEVDVTALDIGNSLHVRDLQLPEGATTTAEPERSVIHVVAARIVEEETPEGEGEVPEGEAPAEGAAAQGETPAPADGGGADGD